MDGGGGGFIVLRRSRSTSAEILEEDKIDLPIFTGYFHTSEANTLIFIGDETMSSVPSSCSQKSLGTWSCHLTARHGAQLFADVNVTLHVVLERSVVESAALVPMKLGWSNTSAQRKRVPPTVMMFPSGSTKVFLRMSTLHFALLWKEVSWTTLPRNENVWR